MSDEHMRAVAEPGLNKRTAFAMAGAVLGLFGLGLSSDATLLWRVVLYSMVAIVGLSLPLLWLNDYVRAFLERRAKTYPGFAGPRGYALLALGLIALGTALGALTLRTGWVLLGLLATVVFAVGVIGLYAVWSLAGDAAEADERASGRQPDRARELRETLWFASELVVGGLGLVWALDRFTGWAWLGLGLGFVGLIVVKQAVSAALVRRVISPKPTLRVSLNIAAVGVLALIGGTSTSSQLAVLVGVAGVFIGFSAFGIAAMHFRWFDDRSKLLVFAGIGLIVAGFLWARWVSGVWGIALLITSVVVIVGAWFVWRGEGIILIVTGGLLMVWGLSASVATGAADPHPDGETRILAIGDSFISGEGADEFLDGTNRVGRNRNECRRAATAHPYRIAEQLGASLTFAACSGAKTEDLFTCGQMASGDDRCRETFADWFEEGEPVERGEPFGAAPQLANFTEAERADYDVVLLSIGGNDVGFSTIIQACLLPRSCNERSVEWFANVDALEGTLVETYEAVQRLVPDTPIVVVPYPHLVDDDPCDLGIDRAEHEFVVQFIDRLDDTIASAAQQAGPGVTVYEGVRAVFDGSRLCDRGVTPAVNHLDLSPPNGSWTARYLPATWIHNSMHPTAEGHCQIAFEATDGAQFGLLSVVAATTGAEVPGLVPGCRGRIGGSVPASVDESLIDEDAESVAEELDQETVDDVVEAAVAEDLLSDSQWITAELYRTVRSLLLPAMLLLIGSLAFAIGFAHSGWWGSGLLRQRESLD